MSIVVLEREAKRGGVEEEEKKRKRRSFSRRGEIRGKSNLRLRVNIQRRLHITCHFRYSRLVSGGPITVESHDPIFRSRPVTEIITDITPTAIWGRFSRQRASASGTTHGTSGDERYMACEFAIRIRRLKQ